MTTSKGQLRVWAMVGSFLRKWFLDTRGTHASVPPSHFQRRCNNTFVLSSLSFHPTNPDVSPPTVSFHGCLLCCVFHVPTHVYLFSESHRKCVVSTFDALGSTCGEITRLSNVEGIILDQGSSSRHQHPDRTHLDRAMTPKAGWSRSTWYGCFLSTLLTD